VKEILRSFVCLVNCRRCCWKCPPSACTQVQRRWRHGQKHCDSPLI